MTAPQLLIYIMAALLLQLGLWLIISILSRSRAGTAARLGKAAEQSATERVAWQGWRDFRLVRREFADGARSQCSFYFEPVDGKALPEFKPGQFLTVSLPVPDPGNGEVRKIVRCYSLSDRPGKQTYRITVKRAGPPPNQPDAPPGTASNWLHDHLQGGAIVPMKAPAGQFHIQPGASTPAVFIAGGIGITPMMSMIAWSLAAEPGRKLHLYHGVQNGGDHAFKEVLEDLARDNSDLRLHVVYNQPRSEDMVGKDFQHRGFISIELLKQTLPIGRHEFYVCGPPRMMESIVPALIAWGASPSDVHYEAFGPATVRNAPPPTVQKPLASFDIHFRRSKRTVSWDGREGNLLDFAEKHGLDVQSGCRSGSCGSCETKIAAGSVRYHSKPDHEPAAGSCLLCVSVPDSDLELEA